MRGCRVKGLSESYAWVMASSGDCWAWVLSFEAVSKSTLYDIISLGVCSMSCEGEAGLPPAVCASGIAPRRMTPGGAVRPWRGGGGVEGRRVEGRRVD